MQMPLQHGHLKDAMEWYQPGRILLLLVPSGKWRRKLDKTSQLRDFGDCSFCGYVCGKGWRVSKEVRHCRRSSNRDRAGFPI